MSAYQELSLAAYTAEKPPAAMSVITLDEPLVADWLLDRYKAYAGSLDYERVRIDATSLKGWSEALSSLASLSLFSSQTFCELHISHKPDKQQLAQLSEFAINSHGNLLVAVMPAQDYRQIKHALFNLAQSKGKLMTTQIKSESDRQNLLKIKADSFGLSLSTPAWKLLMEQTQNNLLAAYGALQRIAAISGGASAEPLSAEALSEALVSHSRFSHLDLLEAVFKGQTAQTQKLCRYLEQTGEAPAQMLWQLSNLTRKLTQLVGGMSASEVQIWPRNQIAGYQSAARRLAPQNLSACSALVLMADQSIKGAGSHDPWLIIRELCLRLSGHEPALSLVLN